jgi:hypothetical protein
MWDETHRVAGVDDHCSRLDFDPHRRPGLIVAMGAAAEDRGGIFLAVSADGVLRVLRFQQ